MEGGGLKTAKLEKERGVESLNGLFPCREGGSTIEKEERSKTEDKKDG